MSETMISRQASATSIRLGSAGSLPPIPSTSGSKTYISVYNGNIIHGATRSKWSLSVVSDRPKLRPGWRLNDRSSLKSDRCTVELPPIRKVSEYFHPLIPCHLSFKGWHEFGASSCNRFDSISVWQPWLEGLDPLLFWNLFSSSSSSSKSSLSDFYLPMAKKTSHLESWLL